MEYLIRFKHVEKSLRNDLVQFKKGRLPFENLEKDAATLRKAYYDFQKYSRNEFARAEKRDKQNNPYSYMLDSPAVNKWRDDFWKLRDEYRLIFEDYSDMLLVERAVKIAREYSPLESDTILGIDRGGRGVAKLMKAVFDKIRAKQGLPKTKILFMSIHMKYWGGDCHLTDINNWNLSSGNNKLLENRTYRNILVIDDYYATGDTKKALERGIKSLAKKNVTFEYDGKNYVYFFGINNASDNINSRPLDELNHFKLSYSGLRLNNSRSPSILSNSGALFAEVIRKTDPKHAKDVIMWLREMNKLIAKVSEVAHGYLHQ